MRTALVIMAAGLGSRFSGGIKQLSPVGPNGELIIDYSIFDALDAGFNEIVFIIRRDMDQSVRETIGNRIEALIGKVPNLHKVSYVYQDLSALPSGMDAETLTANRKKPWGTGQAILACKDTVDCPFVTINADDYYGKTAFRLMHQFLTEHYNEQGHYCMAGFVLDHTLSSNGSVIRGLCQLDENGYLTSIEETRNLIRTPNGTESNGRLVNPKTPASMNLWGFTPDFLIGLEDDFRLFLQTENIASAEFLLPEVVGKRVRNGQATVRCIETHDHWFGVTYQEDKPIVIEEIHKLIAAGVYAADLWTDAL